MGDVMVNSMMLKINHLDLVGSVADGPGLRQVVFMQGCDRPVKCANCHNPASHAMCGGLEMSVESVIAALKKSPIRKVTLSGGEPLAQRNALTGLLDALKRNGFEVALYTWRQKSQVPEDIIKKIKWLKVGEFRDELKSSVTPYVGSSNQKFLNVA